jgi:iron complex outermembrane receptor protein
MPLSPVRRAALRPPFSLLPVALILLAAGRAAAQEAAEPAPAPAPAAASAPEPPSRPRPPAEPASAPSTRQLDKVEITGGRPNDLQERRQSTAAKIVVGREEIEKYGDSTLGEVLKRLPGVTMPGPPGRGGGAPRMRGLGSGYTLILLDGQRVPPGFSIESLEPDQVERIEILRAPTAETGARAIAGVINIITREGFRKKLNNLRIGTGIENGNFQPAVSWTGNDTAGDWIYNYSLSAFKSDRESDSSTTRERTNLSDGSVVESYRESNWSNDKRQGVNANGRLQWRGEKGMAAVLQPFLVYSEGDTQRRSHIEPTGPTPPAYVDSTGEGSGHFSLVRLNAEWRQPVSEAGRIELKTGIGQHLLKSDSRAVEQPPGGGATRTRTDHTDNADTTWHFNAKYNLSMESEHNLVSGVEAESNRRRDASVTLYDGIPLLTDSGDNLTARTLRLAAFAQDEWTISPNWSAHAGLRWEGVRVESDGYDSGNAGLTGNVSNRSSVWTPLLHTVWKPDPKGNDQVRMSLTRTYRSPSLQNLIARPSVNSRAPLVVNGVEQGNTATTADRAGNPDLKPELATGLDVAFEHYLSAGGLLSANVFYRRISDYMRSVTREQAVNYTGVPRYVTRTENVGDAQTQGLELEARFRLSDAIAGAPKVDVRLNGSLFHSKVKPVPGPDNRLDQQPDGTANIGADYKIPGTPLAIGGNLNWTPAYTVRVTDVQWTEVGHKLQGDAFVVWTLNPSAQLRVAASNVAPRDYVTGSRFEDAAFRDVSETTTPTRVNWQLRLELKL